MALGDLRREDWERVDAELDRLIDMAPPVREQALRELDAREPELTAVIRRILAADRSPLDRPAVEAAAELVESEAGQRQDPALGKRVGPYRLIEQLGAGGMGVVYLAHRDDEQFRQRVALKLVRGHLGGEAILQRFLAERQILAELEHPNIARLLDGGVGDDGQPYLAMEYVDGLPLDEHCAREGLGVRARLALFLEVCAAVDAAHRRLVVHRDLKPGNILVDTEGRVKVLDFGVAKWLDEERAGEFADLTMADAAPFTPESSAPEQLQGGAVTTATDVYALGVLLYRLLTGQRPFDLDGAPLTERIHRLTSEDARPPSDVVDPSRRRALRGDLDHIVAQAMRKEPERRYASARELAADVERHLDGHPVTAAPDSRGYRLRKFVGRHAVPVVLSAVAVLALVGGLVGATWQARIAERERAAAERQAARAERIADSLVRVFEDANPYSGRGSVPSALEILDANVARMRTEFADEPALRAELLLMMARAYGGLGHMEPVDTLLTESQAVRDSLFGPESLASAEVRLRRFGLLRRRGDLDAARELLPGILAAYERHTAPDAPERITVYEAAASFANEEGRLAAADSLSLLVLDLRRRHFAADDPALATSYAHRAIILDHLERDDESLRMYEQAIAIFAAHADQRHNLASTLGNYAILLQNLGRLAEAADAQRESIALTRAVGLESGDTLANHLNTYGGILNDLGRYDESIPVLREAARLNEAAGGRDGIRWIATSLTLGTALTHAGELDEAREWLTAGTDGMGRLVGEGHLYYGVALSYRAIRDRRAGETEQARLDLVRSLALLEPHLPTRARNTVSVLTELGEMALATDDTDGAAAYLVRAVRVAEDSLPAHDPFRSLAEAGLGEVRRREGDAVAAEVLLRWAADNLTALRGEEDAWARMARGRLAQLDPDG